jgi:hypothetical protein
MAENDELERFIRQNRDEFDDKQPPEKIWKQVEHNLGFKTKTIWWNNVTVWRAAAMIFMVLSVYLMIPRGQAGDAKVAKEFSDVEAFYVKEISDKVQLIDEISKGNSNDDFTHDFQQLEAMYFVLKEELKTRPTKKVKDALVLNLLVRINLLNQQLQRVEDEFGEEKSEKSTSI